MPPINPAARLQGGSLGDSRISAIRPFGLLFSDANLTVRNETALMRIVSNFRDLKLSELDATQRALMVQYFCFYAEKAVMEERILTQPAPTSNLTDIAGRDGLQDGPQQDLQDPEPNEYEISRDPRKRKRATQLPDLDRDEREEVSKKRKIAVAQAEIDELVRNLEPIRFALSSEITIAHIALARRDFLAGLKNHTMSRGNHNNKNTVSTFSPTETVEITNYFFTTMLGNGLQERIAALVDFCKSGAVEGAIGAGDSRAMELAHNEEIPLPLRTFYLHFARAHQHDLDFETPYSTLMRYKQKLALQDQWNIIVSKGSRFKAELAKFIKFPGARKGYKKAIRKHVCSKLSIASPETFGRDIGAEIGIRTLVSHFSCGILVVLPPGADKKFRDWGNSKMHQVLMLFKKVMAALESLCKMIATNIYSPIVSGRPLPELPRNIQGFSLEQMLEILDPMEVKRETIGENERALEENNRIGEERIRMREPNSVDRW